MNKKLRIIHLEDSQADCDLIREMLKESDLPCEIIRLDGEEAFEREMRHGEFDVVLADCKLPTFTGQQALEVAQRLAPEVPFIFVSGTMGEETAIESLRSGATDYVLKDRLGRLAPAIERAIAEAQERVKIREMENRLRQAQRLESVGTLAGGVAHDFNNILTIIKGHATLIDIESENPVRVQSLAATIDRAAGRGSELVKQLLAFARKSDGSFTATDINARVVEISGMLREAFPRNITFELDLTKELPPFLADPGQVERVLINLSTNARDAMPNGGKIVVATSRVAGHHVLMRAGGSAAQDYICLRVTDTGTGMDEETRQHIFEPFFTTKAKGHGTGLGMPVVYGMMQSHNGVIDVQSTVGKGTSVSLFFPIPTQPLPEIQPKAPATPAPRGTETLLVVDDETDAVYFLKTMLEDHGYHILTASNAEDAHALFLKQQKEISGVFSDLGLPGKDGIWLAQAVRVAKPSIKVILASGFHDGAIKTRMAEIKVDGFVSKPYDMAALLRTIRLALDKTA